MTKTAPQNYTTQFGFDLFSDRWDRSIVECLIEFMYEVYGASNVVDA